MAEVLAEIQKQALQHQKVAGRPLVTLSYAQTLDGSLTPWPGKQVALSGPQSKFATHQIRAAHDAILVGIGTVLADDPRLTARQVGGPHPRPIIVDSHLRTPAGARLFTDNPHSPIIASLEGSNKERDIELVKAGASIMRLPAHAGRVDLEAMLVMLGKHGIRSVMVEGGAAIITSFLARGLVDWLVVTVIPVLSGGLHIGDLPFARWEEFPQFDTRLIEQVGRDLIVWGKFN